MVIKQGLVGIVLLALLPHLATAVNVKDFGAVGDGKADDTAAIATAISNTCRTPGTSPDEDRTVFFPAGTYRVTTTVLLTPEHSGLSLVGTRGPVISTRSFGDNYVKQSVLQYDGPADGTLLELRAMKNLRMVEMAFDGSQKAGKLIRINSSDNVSADKKWVTMYKQRASTGHFFQRVTLKNAAVGISLSDDAYMCSDVSSFYEMDFQYLDIGFDARSEQNLSYVFMHPSAGFVKTVFKFTGGGLVDAINVNCHHVDLIFDITKCGINSGTFNLTSLRPEQGGATPGKRPMLVKASGEVNITVTGARGGT